MRPFAVTDGHDAPGLTFEFSQGVAAMTDDIRAFPFHIGSYPQELKKVSRALRLDEFDELSDSIP